MNDPRPLSDGLDRLVRSLGAPSARAVRDVFGVWEQVVGPQVHEHTTLVGLRDGTLRVEVDDPAWLTQLRFLEADLVGRLQAELGVDAPDRIELRVRRGGSRGPGGS